MAILKTLPLLLLLVGTLLCAEGYVSETCRDSTGKDMKCPCAKTEPGIYCPENYYCPEYNNNNAVSYMDALLAPPNYCEITMDPNGKDPYVKCPCPPGFYCPTNSSQPTYCCKGFYCPSTGNVTQEIEPGTGLGTWGSLAYECPKGKYCQTAQIKPFDCPNLGRCPEGSSDADKKGQWALLIVAIVLIFLAFMVLEYRRDRLRKLQKLMFQKENPTTQTTATGSAPDRTHNNPLAAPIAGDLSCVNANIFVTSCF